MGKRSEGGFTLIELLVTMSVGLTMLAAILSVWAGAATTEKVGGERYASVDIARTALEHMTRDVRESVAVTNISDRLVTLKLWTRAGAAASALHVITYDCGTAGAVASSYRCVRTDTTAGTPGVTVIDRLSSPSVFTTTTGRPELRFSLSVLVAGAVNPVVLQSAASSRNCPGALPCAGP